MLGTMSLLECSFLFGSNKLRILGHDRNPLRLQANVFLQFPNQVMLLDAILQIQIRQLTKCSKINLLAFLNLFVEYHVQQCECP